jgi:hypothetical protein
MKSFREEVLVAKDPHQDKAPKLQSTKIFEFFIDFRDFLHDHLGTISKRPLSYVIRNEVEIPNSNDDPAFGVADTRFVSYLHEVKHRAPIKIEGTDDYDSHFV